MSNVFKKKPRNINTLKDLNMIYGELLNSVKRLTIGSKYHSVPEKSDCYTVYCERISETGKDPTFVNLEIEAENHRSAESRISDVDVASKLTYFTQKMVVAKAQTAMLAHANLASPAVLRLLG